MDARPNPKRPVNFPAAWLVAGIFLFLAGTLFPLRVVDPNGLVAKTVGTIMVLVGGVGYLIRRRNPQVAAQTTARVRLSRNRRRAALAVLALGVTALAAWFLLPKVQAFDGLGDADRSAVDVTDATAQGWIAVRGPYYSVMPVYDGANDTTYVIWGPGYDRDAQCFALRVAGDHRDFRSDSLHMGIMFLDRQDGNRSLAPVPASVRAAIPTGNGTKEPGCAAVRALDGTFTQVTPVAHELSFLAGIVLIPVGLALLHPEAPWKSAVLPGGGALAGFALVRWGLSGGGDPLWLMVAAPVVLLLPFLIGAIGAWLSQHKPRRLMVFSALLAYSSAYIFTFMAFVGFYPSPPFG